MRQSQESQPELSDRDLQVVMGEEFGIK